MNINFAKQSLEWVKGLGVQEVLVCAGARNASLVYALDEFDFTKRSFFEERSAGFYALGKIAAHNRPVAVITTSGTAVAELLPATIEAYYQGRPLILITADRPKAYRGTGAPQTIEQAGIFGPYVEASLDLELGDTPQLKRYSFQRPLHLNLCFAEPLLTRQESHLPAWPLPQRKELKTEYSSTEHSVLQQIKNPLVLVSELPETTRSKVQKLLREKNWECYLEAPSGLKAEGLNSIENELQIRKLLKTSRWDSVIRIGSVPTTRIWRDLEDLDLPVYSFSHRPFKGLAHPKAKLISLDEIAALADLSVKTTAAPVTSYRKKLEELFANYPQSEPAYFYQIFKRLPEEALLYIGNSLPIREWDLVWDRQKNFEIFSHRGANGIDGQISGFLGRAENTRPNFAILGDLTTLYDLSAFWAFNPQESGPTQLVVINNHGGKIFSRMFDKREFLNQHRLNFSALAQMWNWSYQAPKTLSDWDINASPAIVEICPDEEQTTEFWKQLEGLSES